MHAAAVRVWCVARQVARLVFGAEMAQETLLASQRVEPRKLLAAGFRFKHPTVEEILQQAVAASK